MRRRLPLIHPVDGSVHLVARPMTTIAFRSIAAPCRVLVLLGLIVLACGCTATPQEQLQGRWYNDATSIRFRSDGSVIYNSATTGLTSGRYFFDGHLRTEATGTPVPNLTLDLVRDGQIERRQLEVRFLGDQRLRLQSVETVARGRPSDGIATLMVLRRAADEGDAAVARVP